MSESGRAARRVLVRRDRERLIAVLEGSADTTGANADMVMEAAIHEILEWPETLFDFVFDPATAEAGEAVAKGRGSGDDALALWSRHLEVLNLFCLAVSYLDHNGRFEVIADIYHIGGLALACFFPPGVEVCDVCDLAGKNSMRGRWWGGGSARWSLCGPLRARRMLHASTYAPSPPILFYLPTLSFYPRTRCFLRIETK